MPGAGLFIPGFLGSAGIWMGFIKDCKELANQAALPVPLFRLLNSVS